MRISVGDRVEEIAPSRVSSPSGFIRAYQVLVVESPEEEESPSVKLAPLSYQRDSRPIWRTVEELSNPYRWRVV